VRNLARNDYEDIRLRDAINVATHRAAHGVAWGPALGHTAGTADENCCRPLHFQEKSGDAYEGSGQHSMFAKSDQVTVGCGTVNTRFAPPRRAIKGPDDPERFRRIARSKEGDCGGG